jgi:hypothetical protein
VPHSFVINGAPSRTAFYLAEARRRRGGLKTFFVFFVDFVVKNEKGKTTSPRLPEDLRRLSFGQSSRKKHKAGGNPKKCCTLNGGAVFNKAITQ